MAGESIEGGEPPPPCFQMQMVFNVARTVKCRKSILTVLRLNPSFAYPPRFNRRLVRSPLRSYVLSGVLGLLARETESSSRHTLRFPTLRLLPLRFALYKAY